MAKDLGQELRKGGYNIFYELWKKTGKRAVIFKELEREFIDERSRLLGLELKCLHNIRHGNFLQKHISLLRLKRLRNSEYFRTICHPESYAT